MSILAKIAEIENEVSLIWDTRLIQWVSHVSANR